VGPLAETKKGALSIYTKLSLIGKKLNERTKVFVLLKQKKFE